MKQNKHGIFQNKNFVLLWLGQLVSNVGSNMHSLAVMWYVLEATGSTAKAGITLIFTTVPNLLLSPLAGPLADRMDRKKIIVISDIINGMLVGMIAILSFTNHLDLWMLYAISALMSATSAFFGPAVNATIPAIVKKENLVSANSLSQMTRYGTSILGPAVGGILIAFIGIPGLFLLNSISFILSGLSESFMRIPYIAPKVAQKKSLLSEFKEGVIYTITNKNLLHLMIVAGVIINFFYAPLTLYIAVFAKDALHAGSKGYGILLSALSAGGLTMSFVIPKISRKLGEYKLLFIGLTLEGVMLIPFTFVSNVYTGVIILYLLGCAFGIVNVIFGTVIQKIVPNHIMGRVSSVLNILCTLTMPLGYYLGGVVLELIPPTTIYLFTGIIAALAGLSTYRLASLDTKEEDETDCSLAS